MLDMLLGNLWPYVLAAGGAVVALVASYAKGRKDASARAAQRADKGYIETRKRIDAVDHPDDSTVDDWLRDRAKR